jgi:hypothetical protein
VYRITGGAAGAAQAPGRQNHTTSPSASAALERSAISIELRMVSASGDNVVDETLRLLGDPDDDA